MKASTWAARFPLCLMVASGCSPAKVGHAAPDALSVADSAFDAMTVGNDFPRAVSSVSETLTINAADVGYAIPAHYVGLSFSRDSISGANGYELLFHPTRNSYYSHLVNLLQQIGVQHLRTVSGTATAGEPDPTGAQDDDFFQFARDVGLGGQSVIYSLHLFNEDDASSPPNTSNTTAASHIWQSSMDQPLLESFALDNEPDWKSHYRSPYPDPVITGYETPPGEGYVDKWTQLYKVVQNAIGSPDPPAAFSGPDTGSNYPVSTDANANTSINGVPFTLRFAIDQQARISQATQHYYGGADENNGVPLTALQMAENMLSASWLTDYGTLYYDALAGDSQWPAGLAYRLTESNAYSGGQNPASPIFATALWALDYFHFWARHGCAGIDPFTRVAQYNSPIYQDPSTKDFVAQPLAYGMLAFGQGSSGTAINAAGFTFSASYDWLTGYGVVSSTDLYVTVINKTFRSIGMSDANVTISQPAGFSPKSARYLVLASAPGQSGDATATTATLGGASIPTSGNWAGTWNTIPVNADGSIGPLAVQATCAVIVDISNR